MSETENNNKQRDKWWKDDTKSTSMAGVAAIFSAIAGTITLVNAPTWPVAIGVVGIAIAVAIICVAMLKRD